MHMADKIDIYTEHYFPFHFIVLGIAMLIASFALWHEHTLAAICLIPVSILLHTTHYRCSIDPKNKRYREYLWILGMKKGVEQPLEKLQYVYVNKIKYSIAYGFVQRIHASKYLYKIFAVTADNRSLCLGSSTRKQRSIKRAQQLAGYLDIPYQCHDA